MVMENWVHDVCVHFSPFNAIIYQLSVFNFLPPFFIPGPTLKRSWFFRYVIHAYSASENMMCTYIVPERTLNI